MSAGPRWIYFGVVSYTVRSPSSTKSNQLMNLKRPVLAVGLWPCFKYLKNAISYFLNFQYDMLHDNIDINNRFQYNHYITKYILLALLPPPPSHSTHPNTVYCDVYTIFFSSVYKAEIISLSAFYFTNHYCCTCVHAC